MDGSTVAVFKAALLDNLQARPGLNGVKTGYQAPETKTDLAQDAALAAVWFGDADGTDDVVALGTPLWLDETYTVEVIVQVLRPRTDGSQQAVDAQAAAILGEVLGTVCTNPTLGITAFPRCEIVGLGWKHATGRLGTQPGHGSRFEVRLQVEARLTLT